LNPLSIYLKVVIRLLSRPGLKADCERDYHSPGSTY
jgi:hypothetical protein